MDVELETGRPNACNLCHLDRTLAWTAKHLEGWYGFAPPELNDAAVADGAGGMNRLVHTGGMNCMVNAGDRI